MHARSRVVTLIAAMGTLGCFAACGQKHADGCTKDTDCKGDRVCTDGRCVDSTAQLPTVSEAVARKFAATKNDIAKAEMRKLAHEAFPLWSSANPTKACPEKWDDVAEFADKKDMRDPWGNPYRMFCGPTLPAGAKGLAVLSVGEDQKEGTSDDLKSWGDW